MQQAVYSRLQIFTTAGETRETTYNTTVVQVLLCQVARKVEVLDTQQSGQATRLPKPAHKQIAGGFGIGFLRSKIQKSDHAPKKRTLKRQETGAQRDQEYHRTFDVQQCIAVHTVYC